MSQALYRKYRSKSLKDVVGQDHITNILTRALKAGKIGHAYLLTGPRGVGKTSIARILAHEINNLPYTEDETHLDIIEIDAASNNGVEDVRDLREKVQLAPVSAAKKVYIIDEVHMLSKQAFNALLKTLEEPPAHVVFILATTDVDKLPATIISRTQRYGFRAISNDDTIKHLRYIAEEESIEINDEALKLIAERGDGSFRDSISLLDQLSSLAGEKGGVTAELIEASLGLAPMSTVGDILSAVSKHDVAKISQILTDVEATGISPTVLNSQIIKALRTEVINQPQLLPLLDALLDVPKSTQPYMKLLSVLGVASLEHKPKSIALASPVLEVSGTIEELSKQAVVPHPKVAPVALAAAVPAAAIPAKPTTDSTIAPTAPTPMVKTKPKTKPVDTAVTVPEAVVARADVPERPISEFKWDELVNHTRENFVALFSVLSKCEHEIEGDKLILYTNNAFYKKKLDDPKYSVHLYESLQAIGGFKLTVHTLPEQAPMKDSQAAAIADIMGGGTEVSPDAI